MEIRKLTTLREKLTMLEVLSDQLPLVIIIHKLPELSIEYMSKLGLILLGKTLEEVKQMSYEYFLKTYFNEDDFREATDKLVNLIQQGDDNSFISYFQQVRTSETKAWDWYMNTVKVFHRDASGNAEFLITTAMQIDSEHYFVAKASRLLEENAFIRENYGKFSKLSKREREVLRLLTLGKTAKEIAESLFLSKQTVETHRRNLKRKLQAGNMFDLSSYARAFNLI